MAEPKLSVVYTDAEGKTHRFTLTHRVALMAWRALQRYRPSS